MPHPDSDHSGPNPPELDEVTAERLISGEIGSTDAPPGYAGVARLLEAATAPTWPNERVGENQAVAAMVAVIGDVGGSTTGPAPVGRARARLAANWTTRGRVAGLAAAGILLAGGGAAAATGALGSAARYLFGSSNPAAPAGRRGAKVPAASTTTTVRGGVAALPASTTTTTTVPGATSAPSTSSAVPGATAVPPTPTTTTLPRSMGVPPTSTTASPSLLQINGPFALPTGTVGIPYSVTLGATGGMRPYMWSLLDGSLPAGLTINLDGTISGTPAVYRTSHFTVRVTDSSHPGQNARSAPFTLTIK